MGTYFSDSSEPKAYQITKDLLTKNPGIKGIVGLNEPSAAGAGDAISELGLQGQVMLVGFDSSVHEIELMEAGVIQATVVQKPFNIGYLGIKTAVQAINGKRIEANIDTGSQLITRDNMYTDVNQKLLFPFINP